MRSPALEKRPITIGFLGLALALLPLLLGCGQGGSSKTGPESTAAKSGAATNAPAGEKLPFKIGIMTGTVAQGEDEYRGGQRMVARYGDRIKHVTYPDNFMVEQETTIAQILNLAADPAVKAIVVEQAVPGTIAAIKKVREQRPDVIFLLGNPHEDPELAAQYANVAVIPDDLKRGDTIIDEAYEMGAKTFVHYSFARHMAQELLSRRMKIMEERCKSHGMKFVYVGAPDPMLDQGLPGTQKFVLEDVPREVALYGKDTAFFSTNCGMQEPLIRAVVETGAIFPEPCCPSPTHGFPGALGVAIDPASAGDMKKIREAVSAEIAKHNETGRLGTWPVSVGMVAVEALTELGIKAVQGTVKVDDPIALKAELEKAAGTTVMMQPYNGKPNYHLFLLDSVLL